MTTLKVIPAVLEVSLPEEKNEVLSDGIYSYFAGKYGCRMKHHFSKQRKNNKPQNRVLSSVTQQLKEARKEYCQSKQEGLSAESHRLVASNFFKLVGCRVPLGKKQGTQVDNERQAK